VPENTQTFPILIYCQKTSSIYTVTPSPLLPTGDVNIRGATAVVLWTTVLEIVVRILVEELKNFRLTFKGN